MNMNSTSWLDWLELALKNVSSFKFEIAAPAKQGTPHHWQISKAHTGP
jgi:hypothetical protein